MRETGEQSVTDSPRLVELSSADVLGPRTDYREEGRERGKEKKEVEERGMQKRR